MVCRFTYSAGVFCSLGLDLFLIPDETSISTSFKPPNSTITFQALDKSTWTPSFPDAHEQSSPGAALDNNAGSNNLAFISNKIPLSWFQVTFPERVIGISRVEAVKRRSLNERFQQVELRIGDADETGKGLEQLSANPLVGYFGEMVNNPLATFEVAPPADGKYLTLQKLTTGGNGGLEFYEIFVLVV